MSIFKAMAKVETYLIHCPSDKDRNEATEDFISAINEIIQKGYTWGRNHQIPFDYKNLSRDDLSKILKFLNR